MTPCRRRGQDQAISGRPAAAGGDEDDDPACRLSITRHTSGKGTNSPSIASTCTCAHVWPPTRSHSANYVPCTRTTASIVRARVLPPVDRSPCTYHDGDAQPIVTALTRRTDLHGRSTCRPSGRTSTWYAYAAAASSRLVVRPSVRPSIGNCVRQHGHATAGAPPHPPGRPASLTGAGRVHAAGAAPPHRRLGGSLLAIDRTVVLRRPASR